MIRELLFYLVIIFSNIIQGITGFAGTILAMPFSMKLMGYAIAVPVLNVLGLLSGVYIFAGNKEAVDWKELKRIVCFMAVGMVCGFYIRFRLQGQNALLFVLLGLLVVALAVEGIGQMILERRKERLPENLTERETDSRHLKGAFFRRTKTVREILLLAAAGVVHGMFVCGGPLLIGYLTKRVTDKQKFRATISTVWIFMNGLLLAESVAEGMWNGKLVRILLMSVPFLIGGMYIGGILYKKMSPNFFKGLTYVLLLISGISLFFK